MRNTAIAGGLTFEKMLNDLIDTDERFESLPEENIECLGGINVQRDSEVEICKYNDDCTRL